MNLAINGFIISTYLYKLKKWKHRKNWFLNTFSLGKFELATSLGQWKRRSNKKFTFDLKIEKYQNLLNKGSTDSELYSSAFIKENT